MLDLTSNFKISKSDHYKTKVKADNDIRFGSLEITGSVKQTNLFSFVYKAVPQRDHQHISSLFSLSFFFFFSK